MMSSVQRACVSSVCTQPQPTSAGGLLGQKTARRCLIVIQCDLRFLDIAFGGRGYWSLPLLQRLSHRRYNAGSPANIVFLIDSLLFAPSLWRSGKTRLFFALQLLNKICKKARDAALPRGLCCSGVLDGETGPGMR